MICTELFPLYTNYIYIYIYIYLILQNNKGKYSHTVMYLITIPGIPYIPIPIYKVSILRAYISLKRSSKI